MRSFGLSFAELSRESGLSIWTYRRLADRGLIRTINIGARRLVPMEECERIRTEGVGTPRRRTRGQGQRIAAVEATAQAS